MNRRKKPVWLADALLPKTSPIVPWDENTLREARRTTDAVRAADSTLRLDALVAAARLEDECSK